MFHSACGPDLARWPSPWNGLAAGTARIDASNAAFGIGPTGPGRCGGSVRRQPPSPTIAQAARLTPDTRANPNGLPLDDAMARSSLPDPSGQRAAGLQNGDLLLQRFVL